MEAWNNRADHSFDLPGCRLTCAVLLSLAKVSRSSLLVLIKSFNTLLSSCTRNSFLVISIPRSSERMSWRRPSNDTFKETELSWYHSPHRDTADQESLILYLKLPYLQSAAPYGSFPGLGIYPVWWWWWSGEVSENGRWTWSPAAILQRESWVSLMWMTVIFVHFS